MLEDVSGVTRGAHHFHRELRPINMYIGTKRGIVSCYLLFSFTGNSSFDSERYNIAGSENQMKPIEVNYIAFHPLGYCHTPILTSKKLSAEIVVPGNSHTRTDFHMILCIAL